MFYRATLVKVATTLSLIMADLWDEILLIGNLTKNVQFNGEKDTPELFNAVFELFTGYPEVGPSGVFKSCWYAYESCTIRNF